MARKKASFSSFLFGVLFGIITVLGSVAYGGYWAYNNLNVNEFERLSQQQLTFIAQDSMFRTMVIKDMIGEVTKIPDMNFEEFSAQYGIIFPAEIAFLTDALNDVKIKEAGNAVNILLERVKIGNILGSPYNDFVTYPLDYAGAMPEGADSFMWEFRTYTIAGETGISSFVDTLTLGKIKSVLNFTLPDILSGISDDTLISDLGTEIDKMPIRDLFDAPEVNDTSISAVILNRLRDMQRPDAETSEMGYYKLGEFSNLFSALANNIYIRDIIPAPAEGDISSSATIINSIREMKTLNAETNEEEYYTINNASGLFSNLTASIYIKDIIPAPAEGDNSPSATIINTIRTMKVLNPETNDEDFYTIENSGELFTALTANILLRDLISAPDVNDTSTSASIINAIRNMSKGIDPETNEEIYYSIDDSDALFANITNEIYVKDFIPEQNTGTATATIINKLRSKINLDTNDFYKISEADELFAGIGEDILVSEIIPEPSVESSFVTKNIINKIRAMKDIDNNPYNINNIGGLFENITQSLNIKDVMEEPDITVNPTISSKIMHEIWSTGSNFDDLSTEITGVIDTLTIQDLMEEPDIINSPTISNKIMHKIWSTDSNFEQMDVKIKEVIDLLTIKDLMEEPDILINPTISSRIMHKIWSTNSDFENMSTNISGVISDLTIQDIMTMPVIDANSTVSDTIMFDIWSKNSKFDDLNTDISDVISGLTIQRFIKEPTDLTTVTGRIMKKLYDSNAPINNMNDAIGDVMDSLELRDVLTSGGTQSMSDKIINKLIAPIPDSDPVIYYGLNDFGIAIGLLTVGDVFDTSTGVLSLIPSNTLLENMGDVSTDVITNATMQELYDAGIINTQPSNMIKDKTIDEILADLP